jgi:class 3 adenylate cyclase
LVADEHLLRRSIAVSGVRDRSNGRVMPSSIERKLTTIFSADVVGYARLMARMRAERSRH